MGELEVRVPTEPPVWTPRLARIVLRILTEAKAKQDAEEKAAA
jgi:hypothetical protein